MYRTGKKLVAEREFFEDMDLIELAHYLKSIKTKDMVAVWVFAKKVSEFFNESHKTITENLCKNDENFKNKKSLKSFNERERNMSSLVWYLKKNKYPKKSIYILERKMLKNSITFSRVENINKPKSLPFYYDMSSVKYLKYNTHTYFQSLKEIFSMNRKSMLNVKKMMGDIVYEWQRCDEYSCDNSDKYIREIEILISEFLIKKQILDFDPWDWVSNCTVGFCRRISTPLAFLNICKIFINAYKKNKTREVELFLDDLANVYFDRKDQFDFSEYQDLFDDINNYLSSKYRRGWRPYFWAVIYFKQFIIINCFFSFLVL